LGAYTRLNRKSFGVDWYADPIYLVGLSIITITIKELLRVRYAINGAFYLALRPFVTLLPGWPASQTKGVVMACTEIMALSIFF